MASFAPASRQWSGSLLRRLAALGPLLPAALAVSCARGGPAGARAGFTMPPMPVEVDTVTPRVIRDRFRALGSLESDEQIQVAIRFIRAAGDTPEQGRQTDVRLLAQRLE